MLKWTSVLAWTRIHRGQCVFPFRAWAVRVSQLGPGGRGYWKRHAETRALLGRAELDCSAGIRTSCHVRDAVLGQTDTAARAITQQ